MKSRMKALNLLADKSSNNRQEHVSFTQELISYKKLQRQTYSFSQNPLMIKCLVTETSSEETSWTLHSTKFYLWLWLRLHLSDLEAWQLFQWQLFFLHLSEWICPIVELEKIVQCRLASPHLFLLSPFLPTLQSFSAQKRITQWSNTLV